MKNNLHASAALVPATGLSSRVLTRGGMWSIADRTQSADRGVRPTTAVTAKQARPPRGGPC